MSHRLGPRAIASLAFFCVVIASAGCKSKPGDACTSGQSSCLDSHTALLCTNAVLVRAACAGPDGCSSAGGAFACDIRDDAADEPCAEVDGHPMSCSSDRKARVACKAGKIERDVCDGPRGCADDARPNHPSCDHVTKAGDSCGKVDVDVCATDKKSSLSCKGGKLVTTTMCRGPLGCSYMGDFPACDASFSEVGDPCTGAFESCSTDKKAILRCKDGKMGSFRSCAGPAGCAPGRSDRPDCDDSIAQVGDLCDAKSTACTADGKSTLVCKDTTFALDHACAATQKCVSKNGGAACR